MISPLFTTHYSLRKTMWTRHAALAVAITFIVTGQSFAQRPGRAPAVSPEQLALEQKLQGEYRGSILTRPSSLSVKAIGIQVVALGQGQFTAWKYENGLPGAGWQQDGRYEYPGQLVDNVARFSGTSYQIQVDGDFAHVFTADGRLAGSLPKAEKERESPTMGAVPPANALVLFGEGQSSLLQRPRITSDGLLSIGTQTNDAYQDFCMHLEFRTPFEPSARGQGRGNSGVYLQGRYELQILDSFGLEGVENECGAIYTQRRPLLNMCLPPMVWQTYDLDFTAPKFDETGKKIANARISVWQNGVLIQDNYAITAKTGQGLAEGPLPLPTKFQDHSNPVVYRNIWLLPKTTGQVARSQWLKLSPRAAPQPIIPYAPADPLLFTSVTW